MYNEKLAPSVCHPNGVLVEGGFPFVRFPAMGNGLPLRWGASIANALAESAQPGFFNVEDGSMGAAARAAVEGGYPIYFDCDFDNARAVQYLKCDFVYVLFADFACVLFQCFFVCSSSSWCQRQQEQ